MRIALNALQVRAAKSGVGHYIDGLIDGLLEHLGDRDELLVYVTARNEANYRRGDPRVRTIRFGHGARRALRLIHEWIFLPGRIDRDAIDVFHGPANFLPRRVAAPAAVTIHDMSYWVHPWRCPPVRRAYWKRMTAHTARRAQAIIAVSNAAKADIVRFLKVSEAAICVIAEAAHPRYRPLEGARHDAPPLARHGIGGPYILHVGTLEPGKNLPRLLEAFAAFRRRCPREYRLALAGDRGWLFRDVFERIEALNLGGWVRLLGHVPDEEMPFLYNGAAFLAFPALNEGFGLPPLEAMACGLPVIASNVSAMPETLGEAPLYVDPLNAAEIAEAMLRLESDPALRARLRRAGLQRAALYSWSETGRQTLGIYRRLANRRSADGFSA